MEFPAEVDSLLLRCLLEQHLVCVAVSAVEGVGVSGGGGSFRFPRSTAQAVSTTIPFASGRYPCWWQSFLISGKSRVFSSFSLRVTPYLLPAYVWPLSAKHGSERRLWLSSGACATSCSFTCTHPLPERKATVKSPWRLSSRSQDLWVGYILCSWLDRRRWRHVACCRAISDILHDLLA